MKKFLHKLITPFRTEKILELWPIAALISIVLVLALTNFKPGTILTGWDNLHPEFNFSANIGRSIFAVWQEYQGLGLLGGMGHASDLILQVFLLLLSSILPMTFLRSFWVFATLGIGSIGTYFLIRNGLFTSGDQKRTPIAFLGGAFYLLNLATIQSYFVPFEAFIAHFAALPWLLFASIQFLKQQTLKRALLLALVLFIASPAAYIPTLFVVFLIALTLIIVSLFVIGNQKKYILKGALKIYLLILLVNAFWLLPFIYFTITNSGVNVGAKMNQMATETIFLQNKEFGNLTDVMLLKGFWFNTVDPDLSGNIRYMLLVWRNYMAQPFIQGIGYSIFGVILAGLVMTIKKKRPLHLAMAIIFLFAFTMLATNTIPFSWFVTVFRELPLFGQAFRFPFTKFSLLAALSFSIFFSFGCLYIWEFLERFLKNLTGHIVALLAIMLLSINVAPALQGNLFSEKEQLVLPKEYLQTFDFFKGVDQNSRIANLPQQTFWGWNFYKWGYSGSGFLWYGIKQPILDRAFDVWSAPLENYYNELSDALYSKDAPSLVNVLNKYQVTWLLVDKNIYSPISPKSLFFEETESLIAKSSSIHKVKTFGNIDIYKVDLKDKVNTYLYSTPQLPSTNSYKWNDNDNAYAQLGNYTDAKSPTTYYPLRSLFSNKLQSDQEYSVSVKNSTIQFDALLPKITENENLYIPNYYKNESTIPVEIQAKQADGATTVALQLLNPQILINGKNITEKAPLTIDLFDIPNDSVGTFTLNANGIKNYSIDPQNPKPYRTFLSLTQDNIFTLSDSENTTETFRIYPEMIQDLLGEGSTIAVTPAMSEKKISIQVPYIEDGYFGYTLNPSQFGKDARCNTFRNGTVNFTTDKNSPQSLTITSSDNTGCVSSYLSTLPHDNGYIVSIKSNNTKGLPLHFWMLNSEQGHAPIDTYLGKGKTLSTLLVPPMEDFGQGYSFHLENVSIGSDKSINSIDSFSIAPLPYKFLSNIQLSSDDVFAAGQTLSFTSTHPNESLYTLTNLKFSNSTKPATLILSQSYDKGWKAYTVQSSKFKVLSSVFPFIFGKEIKTHEKVNNWENGWLLSPSVIKKLTQGKALAEQQESVIIVYMPQYLEYFGFLVLILFPLILLVKRFNPFTRVNSFFESKANAMKEKITLARSH